MSKKNISIDDLLPNKDILKEPESLSVKKSVADAVVGLIDKGYSRSEVMEVIFTDCHSSALEAILRLRIRLNKAISPWSNDE